MGCGGGSSGDGFRLIPDVRCPALREGIRGPGGVPHGLFGQPRLSVCRVASYGSRFSEVALLPLEVGRPRTWRAGPRFLGLEVGGRRSEGVPLWKVGASEVLA